MYIYIIIYNYVHNNNYIYIIIYVYIYNKYVYSFKTIMYFVFPICSHDVIDDVCLPHSL